MLKSLIVLIFTIFLIKNAHALISDDLLLMQVVTNTAAQLNELEQLITNAEKHTQRLREISEIAEDKLYIAERVELWAMDLNYLANSDSMDLKAINDKIREIKMKRMDIDLLLQEMTKDERQSSKDQSSNLKNQKQQKKLISTYKNQALKGQSRSSEALQNISHNTGATLVETAKQNQILLSQEDKLNQIYKLQLKERELTLLEKAQIERAYEPQKQGLYGGKKGNKKGQKK